MIRDGLHYSLLLRQTMRWAFSRFAAFTRQTYDLWPALDKAVV
jgi:hypothetical protein